MHKEGNSLISKTKPKKTWKEKLNGMSFRDNLELLLIALPGIVLLFVFNYMPMFGVVIAFKNFNPNLGIFKSQWNGFENFKFFFTSPDAFRVIRNTVLYALDFMFVVLIFSVILALMFYALTNRIALKTYNTIAILPNFLSMVLIAYIVYAILNPASGVLNKLLVSLGAKETIDWYSKPEAWPFILTIVKVWQSIGMQSIIYYAALMSIDEALFEAAKIDGASNLQQIWYISIPHLKAVMTIQIILAFGHIFSGDFGLFYQTTMDVGTLYPTTDIINTYVFRGLKQGHLAVSGAIGLVQSVLGLIMVVGVNKLVQKISPENALF